MSKKVFVFFGLAMILSIVNLFSVPNITQAELTDTAEFFFAEESFGVPIPKTSWELVDNDPITLNLWAKMFFPRDTANNLTVTWDVSLGYSNGLAAGDLKIVSTPVTSGDWYNVMAGNWHEVHEVSPELPPSNDYIEWIGNVQQGRGTAFEDRYFFLGSITLSANTDIPNGGVFTVSDRYSDTAIYYGDEATYLDTTFATTTVTVKNTPEPGTWAMLAGLGLVGGAWYRRRRK